MRRSLTSYERARLRQESRRLVRLVRELESELTGFERVRSHARALEIARRIEGCGARLHAVVSVFAAASCGLPGLFDDERFGE